MWKFLGISRLTRKNNKTSAVILACHQNNNKRCTDLTPVPTGALGGLGHGLYTLQTDSFNVHAHLFHSFQLTFWAVCGQGRARSVES